MLNSFRIAAGLLALFLVSAMGFAADPPVAVAAGVVADTAHAADTWCLHLPGIGGPRWSDDEMILGFRDAGFAGAVEMYDWTAEDPGLAALVGFKRNQEQAKKVADMIVDHIRQQPTGRIVLCGHSGGTGIAVWALEKLPADVKIDELILLASALSPDYDLSAALSHVRGHCYSFCSENDLIVLGTGTKMFGTIDGKKTEAAGRVGFCLPTGVDESQYAKLIQKPYDKSWLKYHNVGDHIGCMARQFSRNVIAPLFLVPPQTVADGAGKSEKVTR